MLNQYLPIIIFIVFAVILSVGIAIAGAMVSRFTHVNKPSEAKGSPYECGFDAFEDARMRFDVRFYLVAMLFVLFDLEVAFLLPWAVVVNKIGWYGFAAMGVFILVLVIGFVYEWKKGALEWE